METQAMPATKTRAAVKKVVKKTAKKKLEKVVGVHVLPNGKFEVSIFLGAFDRIEDAIAAREQGLALREALKAAPAPAPKKTAKAN
jgi:hypothetical protein